MAVQEFGINKGDAFWQTVPSTGGTIANGDIAIQFDDAEITDTAALVEAIDNLKLYIIGKPWPA